MCFVRQAGLLGPAFFMRFLLQNRQFSSQGGTFFIFFVAKTGNPALYSENNPVRDA